MSEETRQLVAMLREVFADHPAEVGEGWPEGLWATLSELGITRLTLPEAVGGSGGGLADAAAVLLVAGAAAAPVPLAETDLLAGWLLHTAGLAVPDGALAVAAPAAGELTVTQAQTETQTETKTETQTETQAGAGTQAGTEAGSGAGSGAGTQAETQTATEAGPGSEAGTQTGAGSGSGGGVRVRGRLRRVGWARHARAVAVLVADPRGDDLVFWLDPAGAGVALARGANLAGEPRDDLTVDVWLPAARVARPSAQTRELLVRRAALARALLLAGAAGAALARAVRYAGERVQFGRPIGRFQAVQQQLALAAAEVAAGRAAVDAAVRIAATGAHGVPLAGPDAELAVAVAKARTSQAAGVVARITHQVHGAIGFTLEHDLRLATTRLWAWRDEDGNETHWHTLIAHRALTAGPDNLWPLLTRAS